MTRRIILSVAALVLAMPLIARAQAGATDLRSEITRMDQAWQTAYNAKDAAGLAALYADDGQVMAPAHETASGRAAIQAYFADDVKAGEKNELTT
jgi:ketosteroid isomerase-like protein